jgi:hypothetical protein
MTLDQATRKVRQYSDHKWAYEVCQLDDGTPAAVLGGMDWTYARCYARSEEAGLPYDAKFFRLLDNGSLEEVAR